jgi:hypothetical protein
LLASKELILRKVAGENILIPTGKMSLKIHGMISLTESGALLWSLLQRGCTEDELVKELLSEYDVGEAEARADVLSFVERMSALGVIEVGEDAQ